MEPVTLLGIALLIGIPLVLVCAMFDLAACMRSSQISGEEEIHVIRD